MAAKRKEVHTLAIPVKAPSQQAKPKKRDYRNYKIDYTEIEKTLADICFERRVLNKDIYKLLGWGRTKFYDVCKYNPDFSDFITALREEKRIEAIAKFQFMITELALSGNVQALIFSLRALGVSDRLEAELARNKKTETMHVQEIICEEDNLLTEDYTQAESQTMARIDNAAIKRKREKADKER